MTANSPRRPGIDRSRLMDVALGRQPADLLVRGANVLDVFTASYLPDCDVAVGAGRIAYVGSDAGHTLGPDTRVIKAEGRTLLPGFVDGHTHLFAVPYSVEEFLKYAVPGGTTTVITEITELGSVLGYEGIRQAIAGLAGQPIKMFATLPPLMALLPHMESTAPTVEQYRELLARPEVLGLGEMYWGNLVRGDERLLGLIEATLAAGKVAEGHTAGARGARLQAYACAGLNSCHEPIMAEEGLERLRLGMTFMAREGAIRRDLEAIAPIWRAGHDQGEAELPVVDGRVMPDPASGLIKMAAFDRVLRMDTRFVGYIKGYGLRAGAVASTMTWDSQCLVAVGTNDRDLALAADRLYDIQGGAAVFRDGDLLAEFAAPLAGGQSLEPLPEIAEAIAGVNAALAELGCAWENPLLTLNVLTTAAIPFFRITDRGYVRLRTGERVGLFLDET